MFRRRHARLREEVADLVSEAEWLLAGHSAVGYAVWGEQPPAWSLVGVLAHRGHADLVRLSLAEMGTTGPWTAVLVALAAEVLDLAPTAGELLRLQRESLIPLELDLLRGSAEPSTPEELEDVVLEALHADRRAT